MCDISFLSSIHVQHVYVEMKMWNDVFLNKTILYVHFKKKEAYVNNG